MGWCSAPTSSTRGRASWETGRGEEWTAESTEMDLGFPWWVRLAHLFNILFITLLIRSGIEILAAHPKLYLGDDSTPGSEWIRFTPKKMPADQLWTAKDEEEAYSAWIALPGGKQLGLGRHWHFFGALGWLLTGLFYVVLMFATPEWRRWSQPPWISSRKPGRPPSPTCSFGCLRTATRSTRSSSSRTSRSSSSWRRCRS